MKTPLQSLNRRTFLQYTSAGAIALGTGTATAPAQTRTRGKINIGLIGVGGRGSSLMGEIIGLAGQQNIRVTAVCDVWRKNLAAAAGQIKNKLGNDPRQFTRFNDLLALRDIDAVTIATPDFSHGQILTAALKAGKDVYVEKPMTIDLASANEAFDMARSGSRVVQTGTQRRSDPRFLGAAKAVGNGGIGQISRVAAAVNFYEARWTRASLSDCTEADVDWDAFLLNLPKRPFDAKLLRQWQLYRETSNGLPGLWMTHYADAVHMLTGAKYPDAAVALGGIYVWKDGREHTDTFHALLEYPEGFLFDWGMGLGNSAGTHFEIYGSRGTLDVEKWTISTDGGKGATPSSGQVPSERGPTHMENWLECLRSRQRPTADIQYGHQHAVATIMAAMALESGQRQKYDPAKRAISAG